MFIFSKELDIIEVHHYTNNRFNQVGQRVPTQIKPTVKSKLEFKRKKKGIIALHTTNSSSRYLDTAIWSPNPFLLLVLRTRSRAKACPDAGSRGRSLMLVSVGSPIFLRHWGSICHGILTWYDGPMIEDLQAKGLTLCCCP